MNAPHLQIADSKLLNFIAEWRVLCHFYDYKKMKEKKFLLYKVSHKGLHYEVRVGGTLLGEYSNFEEAIERYNSI